MGHQLVFTITTYGEMSEWSIVPVLKTGVRKHPGFESQSLRQESFWRSTQEAEEDGLLNR